MFLLLSIFAFAELPQGILGRTFPNGLRVILVPLPSDNLVTVQTWIGGGYQYDEISGHARLLEHIFYHGSVTMNRTRREKELMLLGAEEKSWCTADFVVYQAIAPVESLDKILEFEADRLLNLRITQKRIEKEAKRVRSEFEHRQKIAPLRLHQQALDLSFQRHGYGNDGWGRNESVEKLPTALPQLLDFYARYYVPKNTVLVIAGNINPEEAIFTVAKSYHDWVPDEPDEVVLASEPIQNQMRSQTITGKADWVSYSYKTPPYTQKVRYQLLLMEHLLAGLSSDLVERLVYSEDAPTHSLQVVNPVYMQQGLFSIQFHLKDQTKIDVVEEELKRFILSLHDLSPDDFQQAKRNLRQELLLQLNSTEHWAQMVGEMAIRGESLASISSRFEVLDGLSHREFLDLVHQVLRTDISSVVYMNREDLP